MVQWSQLLIQRYCFSQREHIEKGKGVGEGDGGRRLLDCCMLRSIETSMKVCKNMCSLAFNLIICHIQSAVSVGDEPFICRGRAFICESSGTVPTGGTHAGTEKDNSGKKQLWAHKHADHLGTCWEMYSMHTKTCPGSTLWHDDDDCLMERKKCTPVKIIYTYRRPHLETLWDMGGLLFLLAAWWATGHRGPAWHHRYGSPGLEEGEVAGEWQAQWLWLGEDQGACWWSRLGVRWGPEGGR